MTIAALVQGMGVAARGVYGPAMAILQEGRMRFLQSRAQAASAIILSKSYFMYIHPPGCHRIQTSRPAGTGSDTAGEVSPPETRGRRISTVSPPSPRLKAATRPP